MSGIDDALRIIGVLLGLVATLFGIIKVWKEANAASGSAQVNALQAASDEWKELKDDYRERLRALEAKYDEQDGQIEELREDVDKLRKIEGRLIGWVARLHEGIQAGLIPPLPEIPEWLYELLTRSPDKEE